MLDLRTFTGTIQEIFFFPWKITLIGRKKTTHKPNNNKKKPQTRTTFSTFFLLRAAVVYCCSDHAQEVVLVLLRHGFVKSKPCPHLKRTKKSPLGPLVLQKNIAATSEGWFWSRRNPDRLYHLPQAWSNAMRHRATRDSADPGHAMPVYTSCTLKSSFALPLPTSAKKCWFCETISDNKENKWKEASTAWS